MKSFSTLIFFVLICFALSSNIRSTVGNHINKNFLQENEIKSNKHKSHANGRERLCSNCVPTPKHIKDLENNKKK